MKMKEYLRKKNIKFSDWSLLPPDLHTTKNVFLADYFIIKYKRIFLIICKSLSFLELIR